MSMRALDPVFQNDIVESAERLEQRKGVKDSAVVRAEDYPMLVTFADIDDPKSVKLVDPDNLAASFGEGVRLKSISVQIADEEVTRGIEERLGWLPSYHDKMLDGNKLNISRDLANNRKRGEEAALSA